MERRYEEHKPQGGISGQFLVKIAREFGIVSEKENKSEPVTREFPGPISLKLSQHKLKLLSVTFELEFVVGWSVGQENKRTSPIEEPRNR